MVVLCGRGELPDKHPLSLWDVGNMGLLVGLSQADLLVAAGIRFNWLFQSGAVIPPHVKLVHIDIDPAEVDRNRTADVGLVGDAALVLDKMILMVNRYLHAFSYKKEAVLFFSPVNLLHIFAEERRSGRFHIPPDIDKIDAP